MKIRIGLMTFWLLSVAAYVGAQQSATNVASVSVPPVIQYSNVATDESGRPLTGTLQMTFSLYTNAQGGEPLWSETQSVTLDNAGQYSVYVGITKPSGVPVSLFTSGQAHWLGVTMVGQAEQPRVFLVSVPYAMKAGDATTVGGLPPSAFMLAAPSNNSSPSTASGSNTSNESSPGPTSSDVTTTGGTVAVLPVFTTSTNIQNSLLSQTGTTAINVRGTLNLPASGTATASAGKNSQPQDLVASAFNSSTSTAVNQTFQWLAEPVGNDTNTPSGSLDLLFASGTGTPSPTGLNIASNGQITFASGQSFPGAGTVTNVGSGAGLTGGPITGSGTLSIATGGVTNTMLQNSALTVAAGTALTGGGIVVLGGSTTLNIDTTKVPLLASPNTFTGNQTVNGNVSATGFSIGGNLFDFGSYTAENAFLGFAGNSTTTGTRNTAAGFQGLLSNSSGSSNGALGYHALALNTTGGANTAVGRGTLYENTSGSDNTAIGYFAGETADGSSMTANNNTFLGANALASTGTLSNATAIGANALVTQSNTIVIGGIYGVNGATMATTVGIGTSTPTAALNVVAQSNYVDGLDVVGDNAAPGSLLDGTRGMLATGGNADPFFCECTVGGDGVDGIGGNGPADSGASGGNGVFGMGGIGGGPPGSDAPGGLFVGGNYSGAGDGIDAFPGSFLAGNFFGDVAVSGNLSKGGGSFKIDHPLDPANKYLYHSFVESPDMMNIYNGNVVLDANGEAVIEMPEWFGALNRDFRYQLTCIGGFAPVYVAEEMNNNRFKIGGGEAGLRVSWQVTGIRQDAWANAHRIPVEEEKNARERGFYLHPELYGAPEEKQIAWAQNPHMMKRIKDLREKQQQQAEQLRQKASAKR